MKLERCSICGRWRTIILNYGEQPAQFVQMCKCEIKEIADGRKNENRKN